MTVLSAVDRQLLRVLAIDVVEAEEREWCRKHPAFLVDRMHAVGERDGERFDFDVLTNQERREANRVLVEFFGEDEAGWPKHLGWRAKDGAWFFQRQLLDDWQRFTRWIYLKARQLGATTVACAYNGWVLLYVPGSSSMQFRQKEEEAHENVRLTWDLMGSLPRHLWNGAQVEKPQRGAEASEQILLSFPSGAKSRLRARTSASASGHGKRGALIVLDEFSRIDRAGEIMKAVNSAAGQTGRILIISTANGVSDQETGAGNRFHWTWQNGRELGFRKRFLKWDLHPLRDQNWYDNDPEVRSLLPHERAEQYPANEWEAFTLTNRVFFDPDDMGWYAANAVAVPLYSFDFVDPHSEGLVRGARAKIRRHELGMTTVYAEPEPGHRYAVGADVATGRGKDYSAAYVIDLTDMAFAAEFHAKIDEDLFAAQLHYLGRMYGRDVPPDPTDPQSAPGFARLAVEVGGGYGNSVLAALRDRTAGRPMYGNLHRHVLDNRPDSPVAKPYGFNTNQATRPKILNGFRAAVRERALPHVTPGLLSEMQTFVHRETGRPEIGAQDGARDDLVMAAAIALEMFRLYGSHPEKPRPKPRRGRLIGLGRN